MERTLEANTWTATGKTTMRLLIIPVIQLQWPWPEEYSRKKTSCDPRLPHPAVACDGDGIPNLVFMIFTVFLIFFLHDNCKCLAKQWPQHLTQRYHNYTSVFRSCEVLKKTRRQSFRGRPAATFGHSTSPVVWHLRCGSRERAALRMIHITGYTGTVAMSDNILT